MSDRQTDRQKDIGRQRDSQIESVMIKRLDFYRTSRYRMKKREYDRYYAQIGETHSFSDLCAINMSPVL